MGEVGGNADIQRSVPFAGENVDARLSHGGRIKRRPCGVKSYAPDTQRTSERFRDACPLAWWVPLPSGEGNRDREPE